jgi:hypothetical protein
MMTGAVGAERRPYRLAPMRKSPGNFHQLAGPPAQGQGEVPHPYVSGYKVGSGERTPTERRPYHLTGFRMRLVIMG